METEGAPKVRKKGSVNDLPASPPERVHRGPFAPVHSPVSSSVLDSNVEQLKLLNKESRWELLVGLGGEDPGRRRHDRRSALLVGWPQRAGVEPFLSSRKTGESFVFRCVAGL